MSPRKAKRELSKFQERLKETTRRAKVLEKAGYKIAYTGGRKSTPQQRGAVTRLYRRIATYTKPEHRFAFKKLSKRELVRAKKALSPNQITPNGIFVQIPKGTPVSPKYVRFKPGTASVRPSLQVHSATGYIDYIKLDPIKLAADPLQEIRESIQGKRQPISTHVVVNGYESPVKHGITTGKDTELFFQYWEGLFEELTDEEVRAEKRPRGGRALTVKEVSDKFQLKLYY